MLTTQPTNRDAEFCGRVPLHQTNLIQPHGVLLVVDKSTYEILQASENAPAVFGTDVRNLVTKKLPDLFSVADLANFERVLSAKAEGKLPLSLSFDSGNYTATVQQGDFIVVEIELPARSGDADLSFVSVYQEVKFIMTAIEAADTTQETCDVVVRELKKLSGFDKVMIYRFDEAWNGDVIAEAKEPGMDGYLGLKFPASDVPKQARELYRTMPFRLIPNVAYEPVKVYPVLNPQTHSFTDLSSASLRSVAGVHLEYLRNMGVAASMSTRILKDGVLWGLIACHHRTPKYLPYEMCSVFELLSTVITAKIGTVQARDLLEYRSVKQQQMRRFLQSVYNKGETKPLLHELLEADGIACVTNDGVETEGTTPALPEINDLVVWLEAKNGESVSHFPSLSAVYEPAEAFAETASGLLAVPLDGTRGNYILAFRQEAVQKISWGGNPAEAVQFESDGKKYHPRASFQLWQQTVRATAVPWSSEVLQTAEEVRNFLTAYGHSVR